jgi:hypothetical protein
LKAAKVKFAAHTYPGTQHGFHNDTTLRYEEAAAKLAWSRTIQLFERKRRNPKQLPCSCSTLALTPTEGAQNADAAWRR